MKLIGTIYDINSIGTTPIGSIYLYSSSENIPGGFKICNGQAIYRTEYPKLFEIIGITYGEGDGVTTFNLPDLSNQTPSNMTYIIKVQDIASEQTTYSTEEQVIGTWIDGKPIYRQIFTGNTNTSDSYQNTLGTISNVDEVIIINASFGAKTNRWSGALTTDVFCGGNVSNGAVNFFCKPMSKSYPCMVIVEYTKTTDEVGE